MKATSVVRLTIDVQVETEHDPKIDTIAKMHSDILRTASEKVFAALPNARPGDRAKVVGWVPEFP